MGLQGRTRRPSLQETARFWQSPSWLSGSNAMEDAVVTLNEQDAELIDRLVEEGRFGSPDEAVHAGMTLLARAERSRAELEQILADAEAAPRHAVNRRAFIEELKRSSPDG